MNTSRKGSGDDMGKHSCEDGAYCEGRTGCEDGIRCENHTYNHRTWGVRTGNTAEVVSQITSYLRSHPAEYTR